MNKNFRRLGAFAIAASMHGSLIGLALAQGAATPSGPGGQSQGYPAADNGQMVEANPSSETSPGSELPVLYVTSVEIVRTSIDPKLDIVRVTGLTGSQGWSTPQLVPTFAGKPLDDILDLQFIATVPEQSQKAEGFVPIGAIFPLDQGHPFKGVRVRASENAIEVKQIPGSNQTSIQSMIVRTASARNLSSAVRRSRSARRRSPGGSPQGVALDYPVARHQGHHAQSEPAQPDPQRRQHDCRGFLGVIHGTAPSPSADH